MKRRRVISKVAANHAISYRKVYKLCSWTAECLYDEGISLERKESSQGKPTCQEVLLIFILYVSGILCAKYCSFLYVKVKGSF